MTDITYDPQLLALQRIHQLLDERLPKPDSMTRGEALAKIDRGWTPGNLPVGATVIDGEGRAWRKFEDGWCRWMPGDWAWTGAYRWDQVPRPVHPATDADLRDRNVPAEGEDEGDDRFIDALAAQRVNKSATEPPVGTIVQDAAGDVWHLRWNGLWHRPTGGTESWDGLLLQRGPVAEMTLTPKEHPATVDALADAAADLDEHERLELARRILPDGWLVTAWGYGDWATRELHAAQQCLSGAPFWAVRVLAAAIDEKTAREAGDSDED